MTDIIIFEVFLIPTNFVDVVPFSMYFYSDENAQLAASTLLENGIIVDYEIFSGEGTSVYMVDDADDWFAYFTLGVKLLV